MSIKFDLGLGDASLEVTVKSIEVNRRSFTTILRHFQLVQVNLDLNYSELRIVEFFSGMRTSQFNTYFHFAARHINSRGCRKFLKVFLQVVTPTVCRRTAISLRLDDELSDRH